MNLHEDFLKSDALCTAISEFLTPEIIKNLNTNSKLRKLCATDPVPSGASPIYICGDCDTTLAVNQNFECVVPKKYDNDSAVYLPSIELKKDVITLVNENLQTKIDTVYNSIYTYMLSQENTICRSLMFQIKTVENAKNFMFLRAELKVLNFDCGCDSTHSYFLFSQKFCIGALHI
jgi:hypothetical protein